MCGLAGWLAVEAMPDAAAACLGDALRAGIARRGPDGDGAVRLEHDRVGLVHARLAIIDPTARSDQPFADRETGARIVFNGEIYNYERLRGELEQRGVRFHTKGDTEVLLRGYLAEGLRFFRRLRGMYAFVIYDPRTREAVALRDPLGIKPLYVRRAPGKVLFGSSARGLAAIAPRPALDPAAAVSFAVLGCVLEPLTCYRDVAMLAPATAYRWRVGEGRVEETRTPIESDIPISADPDRPTTAALEAALDESVAAHFVSDVEVGVFQSGGLDSTVISALAQRQGLRPRLLTLAFEDYRSGPLDEVPAARAIAAQLGLPHEAVYLDRADFDGLRDQFLADMESPTIDAINTYLVSMACRRAGLKVALSGVGGDELFGGYSTFRELPATWRLRALLTAPGVRQSVDLAMAILSDRPDRAPKTRYLTRYLDSFPRLYLFRRAVHVLEQAAQALHPDIVAEGLEGFLAAFEHWTRGAEAGSQADVRQMERDVYLRNMLLKDADWAGMAHGVEIRTPLVDIALQRALCDSHNRCGHGKEDLRSVVTRLSSSFNTHKEKVGFSVPYRQWFQDPRGPRAQRGGATARGIQCWSRQVLHAKFPEWAA